MEQKMDKTFRLSVLSAALLAAFGTAMAADDEVAALIKPDSVISLGVGNWSSDRPQQGIYDGMRDRGVYGLFDADVVKRDDATGTWYTVRAKNLGLESRELRLEVLRQGNIGGFFEYSKTPRENPYTINTKLQGIGSTELTGNRPVNNFPARDVSLGTERELFRLGAFKSILPGLEFKIDFKNEEKKGTRQWGWGSAPLFSVEPINSTTRQLEAILQYTGKRLQLSGGYYGSWFDNQHTLVLQTLTGFTGGTASFNPVTPLTLPLDNQAHQLFLDGDYAFTDTTQGTFKLAYTRATQDEYLPTYDLTGPNTRFAGAPSRLNGQVDTTLVQFGLSSRPLPKLSVTASLRYYDVDDKTPVNQFVETVNNGVTTRVYNTPHSYTTTSGKLEATYRLPYEFKLTGGIDYSRQDRNTSGPGSTATQAGVTTTTLYVPFRTELNETTYRVQLRRALAEDLNGSLAFLHSDRDGSAYAAANGTLPFSNQINPFHIADRKRNKWRLALDWSPLEQFSMQFRAEDSRDKYADNDRPYGLKSGSANLYAIDANYNISENWKVAAWYSYDTSKAREVSARAPQGSAVADAIKTARVKEVGDSFGVNVRGAITPRLEMGAGLDWFRNVSSYPQDIALLGNVAAYPVGSGEGLDTIKTSVTRFKIDGKYALDKTSDLRLDLIHERWHSDDWTWNFDDGTPFAYYSGAINCNTCVAPAPAVADGTTVTGKRTQYANFIGLRYIYKFQ